MNLCVFLAIGETWEEFQEKGQDQLLINNNLFFYSRVFNKVYVFSYGKSDFKIYPNVVIVGNKYRLHRFLYAWLLPFLYKKEIQSAKILRGMQLTGGIPALIAKIIYGKSALINYGYNYAEVSKHEKKHFRSIVFKVMEKLLLPKFDAVIVTTKNISRYISQFSPKKIYLIPNSIDANLFKPSKIRKKRQIIYVGRLERQKNIILLISALAHLRAYHLTLICIGSGSQYETLLNKAKQVNVHIKIFDPVPHSLLVKYYNESLVFVLPSFIEGHPKVLLEAMSCGLPVIGTNVKGIIDVIDNEKTGLLSELNEESLASRITQVITNRKLAAKLGKNARKKIINYYNRDIIWNREIKLLKSLALISK